MKLVRHFHKILTLMLFVLILTQCSEKNSGEYVKEGLEHLNHEQYDSARKSFLKAIEKDASNVEGYYGLGGIYNYQKKFKEALEYIEKKPKYLFWFFFGSNDVVDLKREYFYLHNHG